MRQELRCWKGWRRKHESKEWVVARPTAYSSMAMAKAIGEGPKPMKPSLVEIFNPLEGAKGWAQALAQSHPEHDEAVGKFIQDINQIGRELQNIVSGESEFTKLRHGSTMEESLHNSVKLLTAVRAHAELISVRHPEYTVPLKRFQKEVQRVRRELITKVRPGLLSDDD